MAKGATIRMWKRSFVVLITLVFFGFALLVLRLAKLQLLDGGMLRKRAYDQQLADTKINAQRGTIFDRNMKPLAQSATVWSVELEPAYLKNDEKRELVANGLGEILGVEKQKIMELAQKRSYQATLKRKIESDVKDKIIEFKLKNKISGGIRLREDYTRKYPNKNFLAAVLGYVGVDNQGLSGLEIYYDKVLKGEPGRIVTAKNAKGTDMPVEYEQMIPATNGNSLRLCIDESVQYFVEKNLEEGIINNKVKNRAGAIVMDVNTGEILAMATKSDFDPNEPLKIFDLEEEKQIEELSEEEKPKAKSEILGKQWRNKVLSDTYYPGSVFKMFTAAMGFELGLINENESYHCTGSIKPSPKIKPIHCHKRQGHGLLKNFAEAFCKSCNPVFIRLGMNIGAERFFDFYKLFGFNEKTGIDLPGEAMSLFFNKDGSMSLTDLACASMGQNFGVTPLQMISAVSAIANGGKLMRPHIVKEILDEKGDIVKSIEPTVKRMILSSDTTSKLRAMLHQNAIDGAARGAYVPGYRIAGKTGTSEINLLKARATGKKDYISSFCGFAPADDPKVAMLIFFDTPEGDQYYGSQVAAPVFAKTMQEILPYLGIEKKYTEEEIKNLDVETPYVIGKPLNEAQNEVRSLSLHPLVIGEGETVVNQIPCASEGIPKGGTVVLYTNAQTTKVKVKVPKLTGLTVYNANKTAISNSLNIKLAGNNLTEEGMISTSQSIAEGTEVNIGTVITVNFAHGTASD